MYLTEPKMSEIVKKQYKYKLNSYIGAVTSLLVIQLMAMVFSFGGSGSMGSGSEFFSVSIRFYTADIVIIFTLLWAFITAITITTKAYCYDDFSFVTNRMTSHLSNLFFLLTASFIGAPTAFLSSFFLKVIMYFWFDMEQMMVAHTTISEYMIGFVGILFYMLLFSVMGYFVGTLSQVSKVFIFLLPGLFFGSLFLVVRYPELFNIVKFYTTETSILLFMMKVMITAAILFASAMVLSNKLEVK